MLRKLHFSSLQYKAVRIFALGSCSAVMLLSFRRIGLNSVSASSIGIGVEDAVRDEVDNPPMKGRFPASQLGETNACELN